MPSAIPRVFLDSNVWFSAFYGSKNCEKLIQAYKDGRINVAISHQVIEETVRNLKEKLPHLLTLFKEWISSYPPEVVIDPKLIDPKIKNLVAEEDQPIFCSTILAGVDYFVTGNIKDFSIKKLEKITGIKILTPKKAVRFLRL